MPEAGIFSVTPHVIIFDFGKTIHDFELDLFFNWLQDISRVRRHHFWDIFSRYPDGLLYNYECGEATAHFIARVREAMQELRVQLRRESITMLLPNFTDEEFLSSWTTILDATPVFEDRLDLMRKLKSRGYELYVLSNINKSQLSYVKNDSRFAEIFSLVKRFIASCDNGIACRKTRFSGNNREECEKIFWKTLAITKSTPPETVYIDDILDYVEVFRAVGGHGIHHTGSWTKIEAELYKLGVRW